VRKVEEEHGVPLLLHPGLLAGGVGVWCLKKGCAATGHIVRQRVDSCHGRYIYNIDDDDVWRQPWWHGLSSVIGLAWLNCGVCMIMYVCLSFGAKGSSWLPSCLQL
jgi:hypothetical protein